MLQMAYDDAAAADAAGQLGKCSPSHVEDLVPPVSSRYLSEVLSSDSMTFAQLFQPLVKIMYFWGLYVDRILQHCSKLCVYIYICLFLYLL